MSKFKKIIILLLCLVFAMSTIACGDSDKTDEGNTTDTTQTTDTEEEAESTQVITYNKNLPTDGVSFCKNGLGLKLNNGMAVKFVKEGDAYVVNIVRLRDNKTVYVSTEPAIIVTKGNAETLLGNYKMSEASAKYKSVEKKAYGFLCIAEVTTAVGSKYEVGDCYYMDSGAIAVDRTVTCIKTKKKDKGFESMFRFVNADKTEYDQQSPNFDLCLPSLLYKDTSYASGGTIGSSLNSDVLMAKETRMGIPMAYMRDHGTNCVLSISHLEPQVNVNGIAQGGYDGETNDQLQYGSIGYTLKGGVGVQFCYPCAEGPVSYDNGGWARRFHESTLDNSHTYKIGLFSEENYSYQDSLVRSYKTAFNGNDTKVADDVDINAIYDHNIYCFSSEWKQFGSVSAVPWELNLEDGSLTKGQYSAQMGFVGQQTAVAYNLLKTGYEQNRDDLKNEGKHMINFWTSSTIMSGALPIVWWEAHTNSIHHYPAFLRCFVDGMEGILDAYRIAKLHGEDMTQWKNAVIKVGDFLVSKQNSDGSFYRAYASASGEMATANNYGGKAEEFPSATKADSKVNTPVAVRFLGKLFELTGEGKYKDCMIKAADYCYNELYKNIGKYIGGTPDNPNAIDKEASVYALYAFNAAYQLTKSEKYLNAAEHAAINTMTWIYAYDFAVPASSSTYANVNPFQNGGACGFSIISTFAKSSADNYSAYVYYEMYKLYVLTGDTFYKDCALILQNNTKHSTDYTGKLGYKYQAMGPEATNIADFDFRGVGTWLPWSGVANIEPITNMRSAFGNADISKLSDNLATLRADLDAYGVGGKVYYK